MRLEFTLANWKLKIHLSVNRIAICDDVEVERFVLKRQLMVYFQTNGREAQIQEYES